ncbi:hypothetical protein [Allofranklinella schreckenbergeri]|nr:hypothetical protein [Allofranklinella schreckenbergeri]
MQTIGDCTYSTKTPSHPWKKESQATTPAARQAETGTVKQKEKPNKKQK